MGIKKGVYVMKKIKTLIVVADGSKGMFYLNEGIKKGVNLLEEYSQEVHYNRDIYVDKPGRTFESADGTRHALVPRADFHQQEKLNFAKHLSSKVNTKVENQEVDRVIIVAPPKILHELRENLNCAAKKNLVGELNKDLTKIKPEELPKHLKDIAVI